MALLTFRALWRAPPGTAVDMATGRGTDSDGRLVRLMGSPFGWFDGGPILARWVAGPRANASPVMVR
ncbi:hypothetical protein GCM10009753_11560 [Streptantibioticus ferralitis]